MNRRILAIVVSGAVALPMAALAQDEEMKVPQHSHPGAYEHEHEMAGEDGAMMMVPAHAHQYDVHPAGEHGHDELHEHSFDLYGSVRSGLIVRDNGGSDAMWDLGSVDGGSDRLFSRIGVRASHKFDNGMTAGLHIEKRLDQFRTRHQNVWLDGGMGRITLGQQGSPYHSAVSWDGANFTGGNFAMAPGGSRLSGVSFASDLGGPFNFGALLVDDNGPSTQTYVGHMGTLADGNFVHRDYERITYSGYGDGVDGFELSGSLDAGGMNINVGYADNDMASFMGATVGGSFGGIGWEVGFETMNPDSGSEDTNRAGLFVDYSIGSGAVYFYYEGQSGAGDDKAWVAGYSHELGSDVKVIGEHRDRELTGTTSILAVVVGF